MAGTFAPKASLLSTGPGADQRSIVGVANKEREIPGADQSIHIAVYCEYWWGVEFLSPLMELEKNIPTFSKPRLTREHIRSCVNDRSILSPVSREFLREFLSTTERDIRYLN